VHRAAGLTEGGHPERLTSVRTVSLSVCGIRARLLLTPPTSPHPQPCHRYTTSSNAGDPVLATYRRADPQLKAPEFRHHPPSCPSCHATTEVLRRRKINLPCVSVTYCDRESRDRNRKRPKRVISISPSGRGAEAIQLIRALDTHFKNHPGRRLLTPTTAVCGEE
jgi:hypothetical protein